ncbi:MAG: DUF1801 domain-containing protein [Deltaproteobacteria bacterium]|nr:DUF1801 domain-containing protein [Deltaproteobacteria bacterium]
MTKTPSKKSNPAAKPPREPSKSPDLMGASERIDRHIAGLTDWRGEWMAEIRRIVHEVDPGVVEEWKWKGTPVWSHEGMYAHANAFKDKVKITFLHGAQLRDPKKLFNNGLDGNKWRAIDIYQGDKINKTDLKALFREAMAYNTTHSVPKSKGSRESLLKKTEAKKSAPKKPKLLSGGNPQIAKAEGDAPVQAYIDAMPGWKSDVGRRLDALIMKTVPKARKAVKWNSPFYGIDGQGWFVSFHTFTKAVKVTFFQGTSLNPVPPGGQAKEARWIDVHEDDLDEAQLKKWLKQAAKLPGWATSDIAGS